jgi:fructose/tagatose bisphosphate aldolase
MDCYIHLWAQSNLFSLKEAVEINGAVVVVVEVEIVKVEEEESIDVVDYTQKENFMLTYAEAWWLMF